MKNLEYIYYSKHMKHEMLPYISRFAELILKILFSVHEAWQCSYESMSG